LDWIEDGLVGWSENCLVTVDVSSFPVLIDLVDEVLGEVVRSDPLGTSRPIREKRGIDGNIDGKNDVAIGGVHGVRATALGETSTDEDARDAGTRPLGNLYRI